MRCVYLAKFEKFPQISKFVYWPIKVIIVNISKTIKDIINKKAKRHTKLEYKVR